MPSYHPVTTTLAGQILESKPTLVNSESSYVDFVHEFVSFFVRHFSLFFHFILGTHLQYSHHHHHHHSRTQYFVFSTNV